MTTRSRTQLLLLLVAVGLLLSACVADPNTAAGTPGTDGDVAGFWAGLWHGLIAPITFWFSLFTDVGIYDIHNNGGWYDFGYVLGLGMIVGGGGAGGSRARGRA